MTENDRIGRIIRTYYNGGELDFTTIFSLCSPPVYRFCRALLQDGPEAEQVVQETLLKFFVLVREGSFDPARCGARAFVYRMARNLCYDLFRKRSRAKVISLDGLPMPGSIVGDVNDPERICLEREERDAAFRAVARLTPDQKTALLLRTVDDLSYREIAKTMDISLGNVKVLIHRARMRLGQIRKKERDGRCGRHGMQ